MISVDTNIIIRLLTADDPGPFQKAKTLFMNENIFITITVILECEWVLRYAYKFKPAEITGAFRSLFGLPNVRLQEEYVIHKAIEWHEGGSDFADALHLAKSLDCRSFVTFDKQLIKSLSKVKELSVIEP